MSVAPKPLPTPPSAFDLLRVPVLGRLMKSRNGRLVLQLPFLAIAALLVYDGFTGAQDAARNLATVVPWVHFRGVAVIVLLLVGNLFCMGCPFTLPRTLARRFVRPRRRFPRILRNKWLAVLGLLLLFFSYEWLNYWASPLLTAWLIVAYFGASFALEFLFDESPFCKYVCPLGSFNFAYAMVSPAKIEARNPEVCKTCVGKECVNGAFIPIAGIAAPIVTAPTGETVTPPAPVGVPRVLGCPTELFVPQMKSNLDCTQCLDCARACPHDNVALVVRRPGRVLFTPEAWPKRWDVIALFASMTGFALVNAFGMVPPVYDYIRTVAGVLGATGATVPAWAEGVALLVMFVLGGVVLPILAVMGTAWLARTLTRSTARLSLRDTAAAFTPALVPVGLGVWMAHYGFHFLTGAFTIVPVFQSFLVDHGITALGRPDWSVAGVENFELIGLLQIGMMVGGLAVGLLVAERVAARLYRRESFVALLPWAVLLVCIVGLAFAVFGQPMEMRGTIYFD
ncbi:MAG: FesM [Anaerolineae bacterium]|nr:FesM [Anaerolineae bacterium]